jgi:glycosyltransferase involved in cell wall biosynthesis
MKIHFVMASTRFTGGRQEMIRHAIALASRGHDVNLWVQEPAPRFTWIDTGLPVLPLPAAGPRALPPAEVCLFDRVRFARPLYQASPGIPVHLCQGFEGTDIDYRWQESRARKGLLGSLSERFKLCKRQREIDRAYRLPTAKIVTHRHLVELIARRYGQSAWFVPYGLPADVFKPPTARAFSGQTILVVGPTDTGWKRIGDALEAVRRVRQVCPAVRLLRVAQHPIRAVEQRLGVTDEYHTMLDPAGMAALYRRADVLVLTSNATEGFGLPALEAMACGVPCVLTDIPAFRTFASPPDHAHFVPVGQPEVLARAVLALLADSAERQRLSGRGIEVAAGYTIARSRIAMAEALEQIAGRSSQPQAA